MVVSSDTQKCLIYDVKLSSVGPATVTGPGVVHQPSNMDLAMKLHYLRGVYFFRAETIEGLTIKKIKESMFYWLDLYYLTCGRFRRSESGKPYIRCNDCGVRIIEAKCNLSMDEFLELKDCSLQNLLFYNQVIGPELTFSPLVMIQLTWFKCGGMSVGMRWAHVLGDASSATDYINMWGKVLSGHHHHQPSQSLTVPKYEALAQDQSLSTTTTADRSSLPLPQSVRRVDTVGDYWIPPNNCKLATFSFEITPEELIKLQAYGKNSYFASIAAIIWLSLGKIREESEPKMVTICRSDGKGYLGNKPILNVVKANFSIAKCEPLDLVTLIMEQNVDEVNQIEQAVEKDQGLADYVLYGANPTFVDLEEVNLYGLELNGMKPVYANYIVHGVGDEGVILVLPSPDGGRTVTITLPEGQMSQLITEMKKEWNMS